MRRGYSPELATVIGPGLVAVVDEVEGVARELRMLTGHGVEDLLLPFQSHRPSFPATTGPTTTTIMLIAPIVPQRGHGVSRHRARPRLVAERRPLLCGCTRDRIHDRENLV